MFDILDGVIADATKTKNDIGEFFDATVDKASTALTIGVIFATQASLWPILLLLILPHVFISLIVLHKRSRGKKLHPTRIGKISMALAWSTILGLVIAPLMAVHWSQLFTAFVYIILFASSLLGFYAAWQYLQEHTK
jgi:phosphatidylglycerophosphate synthase